MPKGEAVPTDAKVKAGSARLPRLAASDALKRVTLPLEAARAKVVEPCVVSSDVGAKPVWRVSVLLARRISYKAASSPTTTRPTERFAVVGKFSRSTPLVTSKGRRLAGQVGANDAGAKASSVVVGKGDAAACDAGGAAR